MPGFLNAGKKQEGCSKVQMAGVRYGKVLSFFCVRNIKAMENIEKPEDKFEHAHLRSDELQNPGLVFTRLFDGRGAEYLRNELWEMLKAAVSASSWTFLNEPGAVLTLQKDLGRLIDAFRILLTDKENREGELPLTRFMPGTRECFVQETKYVINLYPVLNIHKGRIRRLSREETENPYLAIKEFFNLKSSKEWKDVLSEWVEHALCKLSIIDACEDTEILLEFEQFEKLIELAYIFNKEQEKDNYKEEEDNLERVLNEIALTEGSKLISKNLHRLFLDFLKTVPPVRINRNLRKMLIDFIQYSQVGLPSDFKDYLSDLYLLTELLDEAEKETRNWHKE